MADTLDFAASLLAFLLIRHKSLGLSDPALLDGLTVLPGCRPAGRHFKTTDKSAGLSVAQLSRLVEADWTGSNNINSNNNTTMQAHKGYYITGRLNTTIYRDDCLFTGPDPDMPVKGLRKYLSASAQLFDSKSSYAILHSIQYDDSGGERQCGIITVYWTLGGIINLPWHPMVDPWSGWTRYHVDEGGLIYYHEEGWDESVLRIFLGVVFPVVRYVDFNV